MDFILSKDKNAKKFNHNIEIPRPNQLQEMLDISEKLGKLYPYLRVDMYLLNDHIYIGELTQCQGGGFDKIVPVEMDAYFGEKLDLNV